MFYIQDPVELNFHYPVKRISPELVETGVENTITYDIGKFTHDNSFRTMIENHENEVTCYRDDVPAKEIPNEVCD